jgi:hypothetical protein
VKLLKTSINDFGKRIILKLHEASMPMH